VTGVQTCALPIYFAKRGIDSGFEAAVAQAFCQASRYLEVGRSKHGARIGTPPQDRLAARIPGEDPPPVGFEQPRRRQVSASGQQPVGLAERELHGRECLRGIALGQPNDRTFHRGSLAMSVVASRRNGTCASTSAIYRSTASCS